MCVFKQVQQTFFNKKKSYVSRAKNIKKISRGFSGATHRFMQSYKEKPHVKPTHARVINKSPKLICDSPVVRRNKLLLLLLLLNLSIVFEFELINPKHAVTNTISLLQNIQNKFQTGTALAPVNAAVITALLRAFSISIDGGGKSGEPGWRRDSTPPPLPNVKEVIWKLERNLLHIFFYPNYSSCCTVRTVENDIKFKTVSCKVL